MNEDEKRGYSRGYSAGRKREKIAAAEMAKLVKELSEQQEFVDKAFLAALPVAMTITGWQTADGTPITTIEQRMELAASFARRALAQRPKV